MAIWRCRARTCARSICRLKVAQVGASTRRHHPEAQKMQLSMVRRPAAALLTHPWLRRAGLYVLASGSLALVTHSVGRPLGFAGADMISKWIPVSFLAESLLVGCLSRRIASDRQRFALVADLAVWGGPLLLVLVASFGSLDLASWLCVCIALKVVAGLYALALAVRGGLKDSHGGWALACIAVIFYLATLPITRLDGPATRAMKLAGDEPHYMIVTVSVVRDHDLILEDEYLDRVYAPFFPGDIGFRSSQVPPGHHLRPFHDLGLPLLAAPAYAVGGWIMVLVAMAAATGFLIREVFLTVRMAGVRAETAVYACALVGFSLPIATFATQNYAEIPVALAAAVAVRQFWAAERQTQSHPVVAGLAIAALPWLHVRAWPMVVVLVATGALVLRRWTGRGAVAIPVVVSTGGYVALNNSLYGHPLLSPFLAGGVQPHWPSALLVIIAQARPWLDGFDGLLLISPIFLLSLAGVPAVARMGLAGGGTLAAAAAYSFGVGLWNVFSQDGWSLPARFMVPVIPLLAVPLAVALDRLRGRHSVVLVIPLGLWTLACSFVAFADRSGSYTDDPQRLPLAVLGPVALVGNSFRVPVRYLVPDFSSPGVGSFLKVAAVLAAAVGVAFLVARRPPGRFSAGRSQ
jgi:hypothetical protein